MKIVSLAILLALGSAACSSESGTDTEAGRAPQDLSSLSAQVATYESVADQPGRLTFGLFTPNGLVSYGNVQVTISQGGRSVPAQTARFILVPEEQGKLPSGADLMAAEQRAPEVTLPTGARGVYQLDNLLFGAPGTYEAKIDVSLADGTQGSTSTVFEVVDEAAYPQAGQPAPQSQNLTIDDIGGATLMAVDSRADDFGVPDESLHTKTVADSIERRRPVVVVVATPQYCRSRFCGPIVDEIGVVQQDYSDVADFIHLEVWRDFQTNTMNEAAAEWVLQGKGRDQELTEPWVFLIGPDGKIADRWQNVFDPRELAGALERYRSG